MGPVLAVAFFRNLNLGHRGSPGRAELLDAFTGVGVESAGSFQTNGTVIFEAAAPVRAATAARDRLTAGCGYRDAVVVRRAAWLRALADRLGDLGPTAEVTLFDSPVDFPHAVPWRADQGRMTVVAADRRHAVCVNDRPHTAFGTPTVERLLGVPATSRAVTTLLRLAPRLR